MWENELIMFRFSFCLLIGIFLLLLANLIKSHFDHKELVTVLLRQSHCEEERSSRKEGDGE
jgi:hypothetical protein